MLGCGAGAEREKSERLRRLKRKAGLEALCGNGS